ncbi:MAG TPA: sigma-70 family RNA polymerase sigma factor [Gemmataceae bacterium]|jgi:RNA polymerase sigma factor (sigma-70 family)
MSEGQRPTLLAYLRRLGRGAAVESNDAELLERFVEARDETAFTSLLRRHGPLVWSVCRRVLAEEHAAEDAFQATFLVLVRKARSVSKKASVRSWLYGVALRVAVRARQHEDLRRLHERSAPVRQAGTTKTETLWEDVRPILDEEIQRLPEKYRQPVILCYLEGQTNDEAARLLNCPRGTIATRLARARERLRSRLVRRGLILSAGTLAAMFTDNTLSAAVPSILSAQTAKIVLSGAVPVSITTLAEGVLHTMFVTKLKTTLVVVLAVSAIGSAGVCTYYLHGQAPPGQPPLPRQAPQVPPGQPRPQEVPGEVKFPDKIAPDKIGPAKPPEALQKLLKERRDRAEEEATIRYQKYRAGAQDATLDQTIASYKRLLKAELELSVKKADRLVACERHVRLMKQLGGIAEAKYKVGRIFQADYTQAEYERLDAEIALEREKAR